MNEENNKIVRIENVSFFMVENIVYQFPQNITLINLNKIIQISKP